MISIPDQLLERIDDYARSTRETRSGFLQRVSEREIAAADADRRQEVERLLGAPMPLGGEAAKLIREDRDSR
jgi:metal-responsive CopG/Arc/MetJ family transcriptional regulator